MILDLKTKEPVLILNPYTNRFINMAPMFDAMKQLDGDQSPREFQEVVRNAARMISMLRHEELFSSDAYRDTIHDLFLLEDTFSRMVEYRCG